MRWSFLPLLLPANRVLVVLKWEQCCGKVDTGLAIADERIGIWKADIRDSRTEV